MRHHRAAWHLAIVLLAVLTGSLPSSGIAAGSNDIPLVEVRPLILDSRVESNRPAVTLAALRFSHILPITHKLGELSAIERQDLEGDRAALQTSNRLKVGISRKLAPDVVLEGLHQLPPRGGTITLPSGHLVRDDAGNIGWTTSFSSEGAGAIRLFIREARLPAGSRIYVYHPGGEIHGPYDFDDGFPQEGFWTNTVFAGEVRLELQLGPVTLRELADIRLVIAEVGHLEHENFAPSPRMRSSAIEPAATECFVDRTCVSSSQFANIALASRAVAHLLFPANGSFFVCSGGLMNTTNDSGIPYLLTANHCFDTQASATALEAYWDYMTSSCNGSFPNRGSFPRTLGATLLATSAATDFTFVRLNQNPPANRIFLGWSTLDFSAAGGTTVHRVAHPMGNPQVYSQHAISSIPTPGSCTNSPQGNFIYSKNSSGGTTGGSSGSPVFLQDLTVIGQLKGRCGSNTDDPCDAVNNSAIDGSFRNTFPSIASFLNPSSTVCTPGPTTICLANDRFAVSVAWRDFSGNTGPGRGIEYTPDSGLFWFFSETNIEMLVKIVNACVPPFNRFWFFAAATTNVEYTITVTDTLRAQTKTYSNPLGTSAAAVTDSAAFATCP